MVGIITKYISLFGSYKLLLNNDVKDADLLGVFNEYINSNEH